METPEGHAKKLLKERIEILATSPVQEAVRKKIKLEKEKAEIQQKIKKNPSKGLENRILEIDKEIRQLDKILDSIAKKQGE